MSPGLVLTLLFCKSPAGLPAPRLAPLARESAFDASVEVMEPRLVPVDAERLGELARPGTLGVFAGGGGTVRSETEDAAGHRGASLARVARTASATERAPRVDPDAPWDLELVANLSRPTTKGNVVVLVYDRADPDAVHRHEVNAAWTLTLPPSRAVAMRVRVDPNSGFRAGHTYLLRVVQLIGRRESILAEGEVRLE